ncbi:uncharacterized protein Dwil_GK26995 [Drosophila willistoni]|uniref:Uncharacterized protein n=1 Tax=Drosophila willistoni TaxID=7260 RepID=A0A0Q9WPI0_DROWI|nr:uncharacterized protein Dwil_GK26995 [Drosophila willistoni]
MPETKSNSAILYKPRLGLRSSSQLVQHSRGIDDNIHSFDQTADDYNSNTSTNEIKTKTNNEEEKSIETKMRGENGVEVFRVI